MPCYRKTFDILHQGRIEIKIVSGSLPIFASVKAIEIEFVKRKKQYTDSLITFLR